MLQFSVNPQSAMCVEMGRGEGPSHVPCPMPNVQLTIVCSPSLSPIFVILFFIAFCYVLSFCDLNTDFNSPGEKSI